MMKNIFGGKRFSLRSHGDVHLRTRCEAHLEDNRVVSTPQGV